MSNSKKSSLPYLLKEALETGQWQLIDSNTATEDWVRPGEVVKIGKNAIKSTDPHSYVFEVSEPGEGFRKTDLIVMNLLCRRLAKTDKMSTWYDNLSTTTE